MKLSKLLVLVSLAACSSQPSKEESLQMFAAATTAMTSAQSRALTDAFVETGRFDETSPLSVLDSLPFLLREDRARDAEGRGGDEPEDVAGHGEGEDEGEPPPDESADSGSSHSSGTSKGARARAGGDRGVFGRDRAHVGRVVHRRPPDRGAGAGVQRLGLSGESAERLHALDQVFAWNVQLAGQFEDSHCCQYLC